jgi:hypothetical protein
MASTTAPSIRSYDDVDDKVAQATRRIEVCKVLGKAPYVRDLKTLAKAGL